MSNLIKTGVASLFILAGCSPLTVSTDYDTAYDFSTLSTYAWLESEAPSEDIRINNSLIIKRVVNAVNNALQSSGYQQVDRDSADFYVTWFGGIEDKIRLETIDTWYGGLGYDSGRWGYRGYWPGYIRTYSHEYQQGTLIIDIADSRSRQLIWRGTGQEYLEPQQTPQQITESINRTVDGILSRFPPDVAPAQP